MMTSCAVSTSLKLVSGTAFGMPVVPEVNRRLVSSQVEPSAGAVKTGACSAQSSSKRIAPGSSAPPPAPISTLGRKSALARDSAVCSERSVS